MCPSHVPLPFLVSWFQYIRSPDSPLDETSKSSVEIVFVGAKGDASLEEEAVRVLMGG